MDHPQLWDLTYDAWMELRAHFLPAVRMRCSELGMEAGEWGLMLAALKFEPQATSPADLMVRDPYTAAEVYAARLALAARSGLMVESAPGAYRLTERGRRATLELVQVARAIMVQVDPLPAAEAKRLAQMLARIVQECLGTPALPNPWSISLSYKLMPVMNPSMPFIEQAITCLQAYWEDAQLAAWRNSWLSATALETLTLLWQGEVDSLDAICARLANRGHDCHVYISVLDELYEQGLTDRSDQLIWITADGRVYRNQIADTAQRYFFLPWACLKADEIPGMAASLIRLRDGLSAAGG